MFNVFNQGISKNIFDFIRVIDILLSYSILFQQGNNDSTLLEFNRITLNEVCKISFKTHNARFNCFIITFLIFYVSRVELKR